MIKDRETTTHTGKGGAGIKTKTKCGELLNGKSSARCKKVKDQRRGSGILALISGGTGREPDDRGGGAQRATNGPPRKRAGKDRAVVGTGSVGKSGAKRDGRVDAHQRI